MSHQTHLNAAIFCCLLVTMLAAILFVHQAVATPALAGLCYSTDGTTVQTTYTGGDPYPIPVSAEVRVVPEGWEVTHRALFRRMWVWLPVVQK